jgi:hypothetical protein
MHNYRYSWISFKIYWNSRTFMGNCRKMGLLYDQAIFYNPKIIDMPKFKNEVLLGWIFHYYISLCWAVIYYFIFIILGVNMSYFSGLIFGAATTLAPLLIFLPFTGQGLLASNSENPLKISLVFLIRHSLYGLAMFEGFRWFT